MIPSFFPVWLTGAAWIVFGSVPASTAPSSTPTLVPSSREHHFVAHYAPGEGLTVDQSARVGQRFVLQTDGIHESSKPCVATVKEVRLAAVVETMEGFEPTDSPGHSRVTEILARRTRDRRAPQTAALGPDPGRVGEARRGEGVSALGRRSRRSAPRPTSMGTA